VGISPNVILPEIYETIFQKESNFPTAFKNDSIDTSIKFKTYFKNSLIEKITKNSNQRVANDPYFNTIKTINKRIDELVNQPRTATPVNVDAIFEEQTKVNSLWDDITVFNSKSIDLNVYNSNLNKYLLAIHPLEKTYNQFQLDGLKTNHYLEEAITIIEDFNTLK
jgi:carboxyl-terminal processing protease